jgi:hypothetical protein
MHREFGYFPRRSARKYTVMDLHAAFAAQHGVITRAQATAYGLTARQIDGRLKSGQWILEHRGVYRAAPVPVTWKSRLLAACFATGGLASHRCAAALWNLDVFDHPPVEVVVPERKSARTDVERLHRSRQWELRDPQVRAGIPCTGVERTILDSAGVVGLATTERLAEAAIRQGYTSWLALADCLSAHSARGRNGCLPLRVLLKRRLGDHTVPLSDFSRRIVQLLERSGLPQPVVEHRIVDEQRRHILQVDLAWPQWKKAWELDGLQFHFGREDVERDRRKRNAAVAQGWVIQEILWSMYVEDPQGLVAMAHKFLAT